MRIAREARCVVLRLVEGRRLELEMMDMSKLAMIGYSSRGVIPRSRVLAARLVFL